MMMRTICVLDLSIKCLSAARGESMIGQKTVVEQLSVHSHTLRAAFCISTVLKGTVEKVIDKLSVMCTDAL